MDLELECPHCGGFILVLRSELNCCIFRHAAFKLSMQPIPPHATLAQCEALIAAGAVLGCAKPFKVVLDADGAARAVACEYI